MLWLEEHASESTYGVMSLVDRSRDLLSVHCASVNSFFAAVFIHLMASDAIAVLRYTA